MTYVACLKVEAGVVLAGDAAIHVQRGPEHTWAYAGARKVFELHGGLPIGLLLCGVNHLGAHQAPAVIQEARRRFEGRDPDHADWTLNAAKYRVEDVARRLASLCLEYVQAAPERPAADLFRYMVVGYEPGERFPVEYSCEVGNGGVTGPTPVRARKECGPIQQGNGLHAVVRLLRGHAENLPDLIKKHLELSEADAKKLDHVLRTVQARLWTAGMPLTAAIEFVRWLVNVAIGFARFSPGPPGVMGPVDIATITSEDGFRWIQSSLHYDPAADAAIKAEHAVRDKDGRDTSMADH